jgi:ATP-binding protein involved in chromosome partitioning
MKIAVIGREGRASPQCEEIGQIAIIEIDPVSHSVKEATFLMPPEPRDALANWLSHQAVEIVLTSGICQPDLDRLEQNGIKVIVGVPAFRFEPVIAQFLAGTLQTGDNACAQLTKHLA